MMTLKLVQDGRTRIYEAASFTVTEERFQIPGYCRKVTAHDLVGADDRCWWIGNPPYEVESLDVYMSAFIMNGNGKTVESLSCPMVGVPYSPSERGLEGPQGAPPPR